MGRFKQTLAGGIRLVVTLILPATVGLFALAVPIIQLLFERGAFGPQDTVITALVLRAYLFGLPFAAVDQMLIFSSYARKDTWRPALVGLISIIIYSIVAVALLQPLSFISLMVADAVKHAVHTLLMLLILRRQLGGLRGHGIMPTLLKASGAALVMGLVAYQVSAWLTQWIGTDGFTGRFLIVAGGGLAGVILFGILAWLLRLEDARALLTLWRRKSAPPVETDE